MSQATNWKLEKKLLKKERLKQEKAKLKAQERKVEIIDW